MSSKRSYSFFYRNGLSIVVLSLMMFSWAGQFLTGRDYHNEEREKDGLHPLSATEYLKSGHFIQATFENWESEFLQMCLYVLFTVSLRQAGSAESKKMGEEEEEDKEPQPRKNSPGPVKRGGWQLALYKNSLSIALAALFIISFIFHLYGSLQDQNEQNLAEGKIPETWTSYITESRFWFESFQNWQSEFLSVASIVLLSIWLRQKGSPESKPVDAPHSQTGK